MQSLVSWISFLKESIKRRNFDPWEIDLIEIADAYLELIKTYKRFDIKLSADIILVGGILLKLKSQSLYYESLPKEENLENFLSEKPNSSQDKRKKYSKEKKNSLKIKRKLTLDNLIKIIKKELSKNEKRIRKEFKTSLSSEPLNDVVNELLEEDKDIEKRINFIYNLLVEKNFFDFLEIFRENKIKYFLPLLIAANEGKCEIIQEKYFESLYVKSKLGG